MSAFSPVNVAYKVFIQRNIKKQRNEKKNHSEVRVFTLTAAKINSVYHNELHYGVYTIISNSWYLMYVQTILTVNVEVRNRTLTRVLWKLFQALARL